MTSRETPASQFAISSDSIPPGGKIDTRFIYGMHDPGGKNEHPHLALSGLRKDGGTCGVVIVHDPVDSDDWCHGVLIFERDAVIQEGIERTRLKLLGVTEGINDLNRSRRGEGHNILQENDPRGRGYIGCYPGYEAGKDEQDTHRYHFDGYEVGMSANGLLEAVKVLTRRNVEDAMADKVTNRSSFEGKYTNPGWLNGKWVGPGE